MGVNSSFSQSHKRLQSTALSPRPLHKKSPTHRLKSALNTQSQRRDHPSSFPQPPVSKLSVSTPATRRNGATPIPLSSARHVRLCSTTPRPQTKSRSTEVHSQPSQRQLTKPNGSYKRANKHPQELDRTSRTNIIEQDLSPQLAELDMDDGGGDDDNDGDDDGDDNDGDNTRASTKVS
jgi:hypothetical protein